MNCFNFRSSIVKGFIQVLGEHTHYWEDRAESWDQNTDQKGNSDCCWLRHRLEAILELDLKDLCVA